MDLTVRRLDRETSYAHYRFPLKEPEEAPSPPSELLLFSMYRFALRRIAPGKASLSASLLGRSSMAPQSLLLHRVGGGIIPHGEPSHSTNRT